MLLIYDTMYCLVIILFQKKISMFTFFVVVVGGVCGLIEWQQRTFIS